MLKAGTSCAYAPNFDILTVGQHILWKEEWFVYFGVAELPVKGGQLMVANQATGAVACVPPAEVIISTDSIRTDTTVSDWKRWIHSLRFYFGTSSVRRNLNVDLAAAAQTTAYGDTVTVDLYFFFFSVVVVIRPQMTGKVRPQC